MILWAEIYKRIFTYLKTWTETPIVYPMQRVPPSENAWLEVHILDSNEIFRRKTGPAKGEILLQIGVFSRSENIYHGADLSESLAEFLHQKDLFSTNYAIRFGELRISQTIIAGQPKVDLGKVLQHCPCRITATCTEL